ncbi:MAG: nucleotidyltransferase domain-containing protein [Firmicutes bacterium]|nr:nucleotidyltransferase domain-containing protein [Bacillota bacterium]
MYQYKKVDHDVLSNIPGFVEKLSSDSDIASLYLFGSYAEGKQNINSDIDLAVLLVMEFPADRYFDKKLDLLALAVSALKTDEVDLVILNQAPAALIYQVFCKGKLLWVNKEQKNWRASFQARAYDRYFDFKPVEKILHDGLIRRIREGRFGG